MEIEDVLSIVTLFNREHCLIVTDKVSYDDNDVLRDNKIKCLTENGCKTLNLIGMIKYGMLLKKSYQTLMSCQYIQFLIWQIKFQITNKMNCSIYQRI